MAVTNTCTTCAATIAPGGERFHRDWHGAISAVAIESTRKIEQLEQRLQELEAGYGDR